MTQKLTPWRTVKAQIYSGVGNLTSGIYSDSYWIVPQKIIQVIHDVCGKFDYEMAIYSTEYFKDDRNNPCQKVWRFSIVDPNKKERFGTITASAAGNLDDPLSRYDVTCCIS